MIRIVNIIFTKKLLMGVNIIFSLVTIYSVII
jgi:hypothetical protein